MGGKIEKAEMSAFISEPMGGARCRTAGRGGKRAKKRKKHREMYAASMLVKVGVCVVACAAVLLIKLTQSQTQADLSELMEPGTSSSTGGSEDEFDEMLGKLRFVELPGILEVFAPDERMALPVEARACTLIEDETLLKLDVESGQSVKAAFAGKVKTVGEDTEYGLYVEMILDNGLETVCYGLASVAVEEGQPVAKADDIGTTQDGSALYLGLRENGRPRNPLDYYRMEEGL